MTEGGEPAASDFDSARVAAQWAGGDFTLPQQSAEGEVILCQACTRLGRCRLGVQVEWRADDGRVESELACEREHEGGPGVAHGGWTAGVLDELVGHVPIHMGQLAVTGRLDVTFTKPVPVERPLRATAHVVRREGTRWYVHADLKLASTGAILASADAVMVERDPAHFARHQRWLEQQDQRSTNT